MTFWTLADSGPFHNGSFSPTRWSLVKRAVLHNEGGANASLEEFCCIYWYPLYSAARRFGQDPEDARDSVQTLFAQLVNRKLLERANPERGRLRSLLLTMLQNQIRSSIRAAGAGKRGGGTAPFSLDGESAESAWRNDPALYDDPAVAWRRSLAVAVLDAAVEELVDVYSKSGKEALVMALLPALEGPLPDATFEDTAALLGTSGGALRMAVVRLRERYRRILRHKAALALGISEGPDLEEELRSLLNGPP